MAGVPIRGPGRADYRPTPVPAWTNPSNSVQGAYGAAVNQNASDYDKIMGRYDTLFNQAQENRATNNNVKVPTVRSAQRSYEAIPGYTRSGMLSQVADQLTNMSNTGGYSESDINSFRARGLAPIRSIYASGLENLRRNRALQGGYSPNYGAMQAKLAREQSNIIGERTSALNADIAERVAQGKQFALGNLTPLAERENAAINDINIRNAEGVNRTNDANTSDANRVAELNAQIMMEVERLRRSGGENAISQAMQANQGAANLYGTTPALTNMFGNQVLQSNAQNLAGQQAEANIRQQRANTGLNLTRLVSGPRGS